MIKRKKLTTTATVVLICDTPSGKILTFTNNLRPFAIYNGWAVAGACGVMQGGGDEPKRVIRHGIGACGPVEGGQERASGDGGRAQDARSGARLRAGSPLRLPGVRADVSGPWHGVAEVAAPGLPAAHDGAGGEGAGGRCGEHGVRQAAVPWARGKSGFTLMFEALVT